MESTENSEGVIVDSAEYLLKNTRYHDRQVTVGDPSLDNVEKIGIVTVHLVSQSTVFRALFEDSVSTDQTCQNTCITDINPDIFKLMLRFVYGGVMPLISRDTLTNLLLCAEKYNIQPLVKWSSAQLAPTSVDELFSVLTSVDCTNLPDLLPHVIELLQEKTMQVLNNKRSFQLDDKSLELIAMQQTLAVTESQLWRRLVRWAKMKAEDPSEQRRLLTKPLKHVRFLTLTQDQIVKEVMNTNILSPVEIVHILSAVTNNQALTLPGLCCIKEKRSLSGASCLPVNKPDVDIPKFQYINVIECYRTNRFTEPIQASEYQFKSTFTITVLKKQVHLMSFSIKAIPIDGSNMSYNVNCSISINACGSAQRNSARKFECTSQVVSGMEDCVFHLKLENGQPLILDPQTTYYCYISLDNPHPAFNTYKLNLSDNKFYETKNMERRGNCLLLKLDSPYHLKKMTYMFN